MSKSGRHHACLFDAYFKTKIKPTVKPIILSENEILFVQENPRMVIRQVMDPQPQARYSAVCKERLWFWCGHLIPEDDEFQVNNAPYYPGDILYVKEPWAKQCGLYWHKTGLALDENGRWHGTVPPDEWKPSLTMPFDAARIFLRVTDVRVERLQDSFFQHGSTIFNLQKEGSIDIEVDCMECIDRCEFPDCIEGEDECSVLNFTRSCFANVWDSTVSDHDRYGWKKNPWVWLVSVERCENPGKLQQKEDKTMTNAELVRSMTDERLAVFLDGVNSFPCETCCNVSHKCSKHFTSDSVCKRHFLSWLRRDPNKEANLQNLDEETLYNASEKRAAAIEALSAYAEDMAQIDKSTEEAVIKCIEQLQLLPPFSPLAFPCKPLPTELSADGKTNADKIRSMDEAQLAEFFDRVRDNPCKACCYNFERCMRNNAPEPVCRRHYLSWLKSSGATE